MGMMLNMLDKKSEDELFRIKERANAIIQNPENF
jgi:deoxyribodipyrimidine photolyase-related protein